MIFGACVRVYFGRHRQEMAAEGELAEELGVRKGWIEHLVGSSNIFLFMKGSAAEPKCGHVFILNLLRYVA